MKHPSILAYEYQPITGLTDRDRRFLAKFAATKEGRGIVDVTTWKATNFVGALSSPSSSVEILPKIFKGEKEQDRLKNRTQLLKILAFCDYIDIKESEIASKDLLRNDVFEITRYLFAKRLTAEVANGLYRSYEPVEGNERYLKGRLNLIQQIRQNHVLMERFHVTYDEFTEDIALNRVFAFVANSEIPKSTKFSRKHLAAISLALSEVSWDLPVARDLIDTQRRFNRTNQRYKSPFDLAKSILGKTTPTLFHGSLPEVVDYTFDMNELFERFVAKFLQKYGEGILGKGCVVSIQEVERFGDLTVIPDIVIRTPGRKTVVIDTKYTRLPSTANEINQHLFQVYAYCMRQREANPADDVRGLLLYPKHLNEDKALTHVQVGRPRTEQSVKVYRETLDLAARPEEFVEGFREQLNHIIRNVMLQ